MPFLLFSQELLKLNQLVVFPWLVVSARLALAWSKVAPDSRSSGKGAKSLTKPEEEKGSIPDLGAREFFFR